MKDLNKKIISLDLIFENCDSIKIPAEDIVVLLLNNVSQCYTIIGGKNEEGKALSFMRCDEFYLQLSKELEYKEVVTEWKDSMINGKSWTYRTLFERKDIVYFVMNYDNGDKEEYWVLWSSYNETRENEFQQVVSLDDRFWVKISRYNNLM